MKTKTPECWTRDPQARGLRIEISAGHSLLLPFDQFVFAELTTDGEKQCLRLVFATHEVAVNGQSLRRLEIAMQRLELSFLGTLPSGQRSLIAEGQPVVLRIEVTEVKDAEEKEVVEQM